MLTPTQAIQNLAMLIDSGEIQLSGKPLNGRQYRTFQESLEVLSRLIPPAANIPQEK